MFIGLNDRQTEGKYVWEHNGQLVGNYMPWGDPQPNRGHEDCVVVNRKPPGIWHDVPCTSPFPFMCEYT